jgi:hypothetical protein
MNIWPNGHGRRMCQAFCVNGRFFPCAAGILGGGKVGILLLENGFTYNQQRFASLSAIAYQVTGTRWNGYLFFRLQEGQSRE